ncbi:zinc finger MYM-type protein 6-like [Centruroides vittatus]|uniref:zinc finger MYM-type protein 6-like n=1 Tax=Centruroides vittatus TaxID=120091 RepID=UPI00350E9613
MFNICKEPFVSNKIKEIPMSNDTICNRTTLISNDLQQQLTSNIKNSPWLAISVDSSICNDNRSICLGYMRFIDYIKMVIYEEFLFCIDLETDTTGENTFNKIDSFLNTNGLLWKNCVGICTDGAASMTGYKGVTSRIKHIAHANIITTHCFIHREQLASKEMSTELKL